MRALVRAGKTVLCTIHQPRADILTLFDLVYILAGGEVMHCRVARIH